ncbi:hypothetical protein ACIBO1_26675 [Micromonospora sp. NPDC049903]|uniref:hypothetical protein n=1 Tax=Micromonospora sp. NPDC049903 TaxID=3364276 RepID=UPI0037B66711
MPASRKPKKSRGAARVSEVTPPDFDASTDALTPPIGREFPAQPGGFAVPPGLDAPTALAALHSPAGLAPLHSPAGLVPLRDSAGLAPLRDPLDPSMPDRSEDREVPRAQVARTTGPTVTRRGKGYDSGRPQRAGAARQYAFRRS